MPSPVPGTGPKGRRGSVPIKISKTTPCKVAPGSTVCILKAASTPFLTCRANQRQYSIIAPLIELAAALPDNGLPPQRAFCVGAGIASIRCQVAQPGKKLAPRLDGARTRQQRHRRIDTRHEEDRFSLVRTLDAFAAIADP